MGLPNLNGLLDVECALELRRGEIDEHIRKRVRFVYPFTRPEPFDYPSTVVAA